VIHDLRWSAIQMAQIEGRCHRDGRFAQVYWTYASDTVEDKIARVGAGRIQSMKEMIGDDVETLREIEIAMSVVLAVVGLFLLTGAQPTLGFGDAITLVTAFSFGIWFVQVGAWANRFDVVSLTCVELLAIAAFSVPLVALDGLGNVTAQAVFAVVFTGLGCSAFAFSIQVWAQRRVEPARASIINLLEPVVAGFVGYEVGERLGWGGYLGAVIILAGILVAEVGARRRAPDADVPSVT